MVEVSTSILGANDLKTIYNLEVAGTDYFHIDVMDGKFVENNTTEKMNGYVNEIKHITNIPLDIHLMVEDVEKYIEYYADLEPNIISFHYESNTNSDAVLNRINEIKEKNIRAGLAINPNTPVSSIIDFLQYIHIVLIMTVEPGRGGQALINDTINKVYELKQYIEKNNLNIDIEVDGRN